MGEKWAVSYQRVDLSLNTSAGLLVFQRTYSSQAMGLYGPDSPLGAGWTHNQDVRLIFPDDPGERRTPSSSKAIPATGTASSPTPST